MNHPGAQNDAATAQPEDPRDRLMQVTLARVAENQRPGSNAHSAWLSDLRAGIVPVGDLRAVRSAGRYVAGLRQGTRRTGAIRAAAIRAINTDTRHSSELRLGASLFHLHRAEGGSSVSEHVEVLPMLTQDAAALVLDGLAGRCARAGIAVNFIQLSRTLIAWGETSTSIAREQRNRIVFDFFGSDIAD